MRLTALTEQSRVSRPSPQKRDKLYGKLFERSLEMRTVVRQHFSKHHSVSSCVIQIGAALEQGQRVRVGEAIVESHFSALKQQRITSGIRFILEHGGIDVCCTIQKQFEPQSRVDSSVTWFHR